MSYIRVCERQTDQTFGRVVDITTEGMRLCSEQPIEPDSVYQFTVTFPRPDTEKKKIRFDASVIWCKKDPLFDLYDAGVRLMNVSREDISIIEDFIHYSTFEERWLSGIKTYP
jgi:hypothetical protein